MLKFFIDTQFDKIYRVSLTEYINLQNYTDLSLQIKSDGTCIHCYYIENDYTLYIHTLGCLDEMIIDSTKSIHTWKLLLRNKYPNYLEFLQHNPRHALCFELTSILNEIVTKYIYSEDSRLILLTCILPSGLLYIPDGFNNSFYKLITDLRELNAEQINIYAQEIINQPDIYNIKAII
jgi:hypothetical protein